MAEAGISPAAAMSQAMSSGASLRPGQIDELGRALLLLARELWIVKDRQIVLEAVLAERGVDVADAVRDYQPAGAVAQRLDAERKRYMAGLGQSLGAEVKA